MRALCALAAVLLVPALAGATELAGRVLDSSGASLAGATVTLTGASITTAATPVAVTDAGGVYHFSVPPGPYVVTAELDGFKPVEKSITILTQPVTVDLVLALDTVHELITVAAGPPAVIGEPGTSAPATIPREVIQNAAVLPNSTYDDALTLLPNVVRAPDGSISIAGARAPQGVLAVNGLSQIEPVSGGPGVLLPINAVDTMQVLGKGADTEFGRATGSVTSVQTVSGTDMIHARLDSFLPRLHFVDGEVHGIEALEPGLGVSGPIVKGRAWLAESIDYRFLRERYDTLSGIEDSKSSVVVSWTELDWTAGRSHRLESWAAFDPQWTDHAGISAFTPLTAVPEARRGGRRAALIDRAVLDTHTTLESGVQISALPRDITPAGDAPYGMGHDGYTGNYFNEQHRTARRAQWSEVLTHTYGAHLFKVGGEVAYEAFDGTHVSAPVTMYRSDGSIARVVTFAAGGPQDAESLETGIFAQDHWDLPSSFSIDYGVRLDRSSFVGGARVSPRVAWTWTPDAHATVSGSGGVYVDKLLLGQASFESLPSRTVTEFDEAGRRTGSTLYRNAIEAFTLPSATAWSAQLDERWGAGWQARVAYQERNGRHEAVISPDAAAGRLVLSSTGASHSRSLEMTGGYRPGGQAIFASYVRSSSVGNLNDAASIEGDRQEPFVQADAVGRTAVDTPNRVLLWGVFKLPMRMTFAPFYEVHSGFPYSAIDEAWRSVGARNSYRFPAYRSLDLYINSIVRLPYSLPQARVGLKVYNATQAENPRDVQRDIALQDFGQTYTPSLRFFCFVFEVLWGHT